MHKLFILENPKGEKPTNDCLYYDSAEFQARTIQERKNPHNSVNTQWNDPKLVALGSWGQGALKTTPHPSYVALRRVVR